MALTLRAITWASLSETRNNRDKIAMSVSEERRTYVSKVSALEREAPRKHLCHVNCNKWDGRGSGPTMRAPLDRAWSLLE